MARNTISNRDDIIDSRDVIARIDELTSDLETQHDEAVEASAQTEDEVDDKEIVTLDFENWLTEQIDDDDDATELIALRALQDDAEGYSPDWRNGATLIRDSYFEDYARELADDIGAINADATWPNSCIDWEKAADELKQDYTSVEYDGVTYWVR